jgi:hypothetical protein
MDHLAAQWNSCFRRPRILYWQLGLWPVLIYECAADRLTDPSQFDILPFGPWWGIGCHSINYIDASSSRCSAARRQSDPVHRLLTTCE